MNENNNWGENMNDSQENINTEQNVNVTKDVLSEKQGETLRLQLEDTKYTEINDKNVKKDKGGMRKRIVSYIIVGAICSTLGGVGSAVVTMNMMKNASTTNTPQTTATTVASNSKAKLIPASSTENLTVPEIVKKVSPAVVAISTNSTSVSSALRGQGTQPEGVGTGMIFSEDGYILTNYHVISGAQNIKVMLSDGREVSAKIVNYDAAADVAVIKLANGTKVPGVAQFGDSDKLEVGESVVAIGNPLGKEFLGSVTTGIVSAVNRQVSIENKDLKFIQTDAAINPGNSGGPLVNTKGQVIGINTAKIGQEGVEGLGFAIPINTVNPKMDALIKPILNIGISCRDITADISKQYNIPVGVYVSQIKEFSAAEKAGIAPGDIIVQFDGKKIKTVDELNKIKGTHKAGDVVKVELVRDSKTIKVNLTLSV
ncbi:trypsin-like peptidase domain-containing protein [Clostridium tagluense]|uniref:S1C family serine protease n=1 Tax=Clostridium tagluense TaxID=360422 RepID=UPI001CF3B19E|nr:trypsin-like peptidase domain-containing protein [Clostridium tagluense]MCB2311221.1 trypsin-like peptidase domain-containing protein [Clostridium tagluense]MCB2315945.1 trypsin-like peptidase domain-containing protein [Clostridium tagluense]MCB2320708.1 trypsin-like peptidase domain-containing protein [Clostridium tagluense]MCB2325725.1 trypsin-like peptidase domain-containing protein [Clostridium tagluense]MCB2330537.1 trypsin-like peptidase domain-containing protein [Clostridium tagluens